MPVACQGGQPHVPSKSDAASAPSPAAKTYTGTLKGGMVGIGGEHTGWVLTTDPKGPDYEVDVGKVMQAARALEGKRVTVTGTLREKTYVERGKTLILIADSIEPAAE